MIFDFICTFKWKSLSLFVFLIFFFIYFSCVPFCCTCLPRLLFYIFVLPLSCFIFAYEIQWETWKWKWWWVMVMVWMWIIMLKSVEEASRYLLTFMPTPVEITCVCLHIYMHTYVHTYVFTFIHIQIASIWTITFYSIFLLLFFGKQNACKEQFF